MPLFRWGLAVFVYRRPEINYRRKQIAKQEARRIQTAIEKGADKAIIVYDNLVSPPTYGDYLVVVLFARYFQASGVSVAFYVIDSEYRYDWDALSEMEANAFVDEQVGLARALLSSQDATVKRISWDNLQIEFRPMAADTFVPFADRFQNRVAIYNDCFNLLNYLLHGANESVREDVLFRKEAQLCVESKLPQRPYMTWHCRYSEKWGSANNVAEEDFLRIYYFLRQRFTQDAIMVVSDVIGCNYYRKLAHKYGLDLLFSKDYSRTFLGDGALILGSDFYFQFRGGGIGVIPIFSRVPYKLIGQMGNEVMWSRKKATSWQTAQQVFVNSADLRHAIADRYGVHAKTCVRDTV